ncbi:MAG: hypothetical protein RR452_02455 [Clostridia bacterium]
MFERFLHTLPSVIGQILYALFIFVVIGSMAFPFGQMLPRRNFDYRAFPFAPFKFEKGGMIYTKLRIQFWKDKVPDMSQHVKSAFRKKITVFRSTDYLDILIRETCVAEFVHFALILISPVFMVLMDENVGWIATILFMIGNIPFVLIQRYNRPRLVKLMEMQERAEELQKRREAGQKVARASQAKEN